MKENKLREKLRKGEPTLGTRVLCVWPGFVEIIGQTGIFDYVEFLGEYSPWDLHDLEHFARGAEVANLSSMIKIDQNCRSFIAQRALGSGIQNVLFSDIRNAKEVEECVCSVRAETKGIGGLNGAANRRSVGYYGEPGSKNYIRSLEDSVIAIMIEKREAVENIDEILSVKGIDMIQFGPGDYSLSIGLPQQRNHPEVKEAERKIIKKAIGKGIRPRLEINSIHYTIDEMKEYLDLGVRDFHLPSEGKILLEWLTLNGKKIKDLIF